MDMKPKLLAASGQEGMGSRVRLTRRAQSKYREEYELSSEAQRIRVEAGRLTFEVTFWDETCVSSKVMAATE